MISSIVLMFFRKRMSFSRKRTRLYPSPSASRIVRAVASPRFTNPLLDSPSLAILGHARSTAASHGSGVLYTKLNIPLSRIPTRLNSSLIPASRPELGR